MSGTRDVLMDDGCGALRMALATSEKNREVIKDIPIQAIIEKGRIKLEDFTEDERQEIWEWLRTDDAAVPQFYLAVVESYGRET